MLHLHLMEKPFCTIISVNGWHQKLTLLNGKQWQLMVNINGIAGVNAQEQLTKRVNFLAALLRVIEVIFHLEFYETKNEQNIRLIYESPVAKKRIVTANLLSTEIYFLNRVSSLLIAGLIRFTSTSKSVEFNKVLKKFRISGSQHQI